jgi:hypothetical protein
MEKYNTDGEDTGYNIIRSLRFVCWISKATDKHSEYTGVPLATEPGISLSILTTMKICNEI